MLGKNNTGLAALAFEQVHRDGPTMAVVAVRASYSLALDGTLTLADKQSLVLADEYEGNPLSTQLLKTSDLVPFKPATDITVIGTSNPPDGRDATQWTFGIGVGNRFHSLRAHGIRYWEPVIEPPATPGFWGTSKPPEPKSSAWRLGAPAPIPRMILDYKFASGGSTVGDPKRQTDMRNPRGMGILASDFTPAGESYPAPLIDSVVAPVTDAFATPVPQGLAPIAPSWRWRQRHAGTFDEAWKKTRHPRLPKDFSYQFYQAANPELIWPEGYLVGNEEIHLVNLGGITSRRFRLPGYVPWGHFEWLDDRQVGARLNLDGVHIDVRDDHPHRVDITWRGWIVICPRFFKIDLHLSKLDNPHLGVLAVCGEAGLEEAAAEKVSPRP